MPGAVNNQNNVASEALGAMMSGIGPTLAAQQQSYTATQDQLQTIPQQVQEQNAYAGVQAGFGQANIDISNQQLGIQGQQLGLTEQGQALQAQLAGQQQGYEVQQYGLGQQQFGLQQTQNLANYQYALKNLQGQQAASGALGAPGQFRDTANLTTNFNTQQAIANLGNQMTQLGQKSEVAGYQEQYGGGAFGTGQAGLTQQQNQLAQQNLGLIAQANGLSSQEVSEQLSQQVAANQQGGISSANQLLAQLGNISAGEVSTLGTALAPLSYGAGINPYSAGGF